MDQRSQKAVWGGLKGEQGENGGGSTSMRKNLRWMEGFLGRNENVGACLNMVGNNSGAGEMDGRR